MTSGAYYNENDPKKAAWLRELIAHDHIAPGVVDERSITDVRADELIPYRQCHFFSGIGIWSYALRLAGWPDSREVWTGSAPCQPFSAAGKKEGFADRRHLWPTWFQLIRERRPITIFGEQVASQDGLAWFDLVHDDMESAAYTIGSADLCASSFGAPHIRQRLFFVAHAIGESIRNGRPGTTEETPGRLQREDKERQRLRIDAVERSNASGLGHAELPERRARSIERSDDPRNTGGWDEGASGLRKSSTIGGLGDTGGEGLPLCQQEALCEARRRGEGRAIKQSSSPLGGPGPTNGFWRDADWIKCTDGKWRPVESSLAPLAHGAPERVVRLRGFGDGIVATVAQGFIKAYLEIEASREAA